MSYGFLEKTKAALNGSEKKQQCNAFATTERECGIVGQEFCAAETSHADENKGKPLLLDAVETHLPSPDDSQRTRFISRTWPREPHGKIVIMKGTQQLGKQTPNGLIWGATLNDFYYYRSMEADCASYLLTSSGSCLAAKMRQLGELDIAKDEIARADKEPEPEQLVLPGQVALDILSREIAVWDERHCVRLLYPALSPEIPLAPPSATAHVDISSIKPENYPGPWPLVPFSQAERGQAVKLETLIPYSLLPQKLIVHDPWNLLQMQQIQDADTEWTGKPDVTHIYTLSPLTKPGEAKCAQQEKLFNSALDRGVGEYVRVSLPEKSAGAADSLSFMSSINVKVPPYPHKKETPAAHLYLSPTHKAGTGNHSAVYYAEWELPRSLLVPDELCRGCINDEIDAMRESGELAELAKEALAKARGQADMPMVEIETKVKWQTPLRGDNCSHLLAKYTSGENKAPPTTSVRVCAKLSVRGDRHLKREAKVYQALPAHLAEHYSGFNIVRPSPEPVPVGAVVPQFYGYYAPPVASSSTYLSPIMLLEDCGAPIEPRLLTADQKKECWSLLYRLHEADWLQQSVAPRNIVMQPGPLTVSQGSRSGSGTAADMRFRVIDFGRAVYFGPHPKDGQEDIYAELRLGDALGKALLQERNDVDEMMGHGFGSSTR
ncbi:hypothetical protein MKEN_01061300 [Mycena kentingensis (nom. inval.)]|nr:hypothetical protein MKEN_01061300 [Mycena kentingensis (nom. inval.)]